MGAGPPTYGSALTWSPCQNPMAPPACRCLLSGGLAPTPRISVPPRGGWASPLGHVDDAGSQATP